MTLSIPLGARADLAIAAMNATSIVGMDNLFGLAKRRHQLLGGSLGIEFIPKRRGGLRLELSLLDGWLQPVNNVGQGSVNDAERSRGAALRFVAGDSSGRLRLDAAFARSRFISPPDPLLSQGADLVALPPVWRNARYLDASYDLLKEVPVTRDRKASLTLGLRHERVDPLFRSIAAPTQPDKAQNQFELTGSIGEITGQFSHLRFNDNLAGIPSILKLLTRADRAAVGAPLASLFGPGARVKPLLPRVSYSFDKLRQFGAAVPVGGGFEADPGAIPDLVAGNHGFVAEWEINRIRIGYRYSRSSQDNRQAGREIEDLNNLANALSISITATRALNMNFDVSADSAFNREIGRTDRSRRLAFGINLKMGQRALLAANLSGTLSADSIGASRGRNGDCDVQWSYRFAVGKERFTKTQGQFFIRYATRLASSINNIFRLNDISRSHTVNTGLSFTFF
jgi:hypothetical protein